jgi:hypothetical protein
MTYHIFMKESWITIVETKAFQERAKSRMSREEIGSAVTMIARNPTCGRLIKGTGGIRKVRFAVGGRGKSGGVRIIYYFYSENIPVFLLTVFAKNEKSDLTQAERKILAGLAKKLRDTYGVKED